LRVEDAERPPAVRMRRVNEITVATRSDICAQPAVAVRYSTQRGRRIRPDAVLDSTQSLLSDGLGPRGGPDVPQDVEFYHLT
jgi:hypothetical protein